MAIETERARSPVRPRRLWFGFTASAVSWILLGCLDILITWRACTHQENFGIPSAHPAVRIAFGVVAVALLIITIGAGFTSYRSWRSLSARDHLLDAEAVERHEFMALLGVIVSITLGAATLRVPITSSPGRCGTSFISTQCPWAQARNITTT
jgi:hypothetical protein